MENEFPQTHQKKSTFIQTFFIILFIILSFGGGIYYYQTRKAKHTVLSASQIKQKKNDMSTIKQTPAPLTSKQQQQISKGTSTATKEKKFYITGGNFYFTPNTITVNQGDTVKIVFNNISGSHDFAVDNFHVRTPIVRAGQFATISVTVDKKGIYEFYSTTPEDRRQNMKGTIVVQ